MLQSYGLAIPLLLAQLSTLGLIVGWVALVVAALRRLRGAQLTPGLQLGWVLLTLLLPVLGALAVLIIWSDERPTRRRPPLWFWLALLILLAFFALILLVLP